MEIIKDLNKLVDELFILSKKRKELKDKWEEEDDILVIRQFFILKEYKEQIKVNKNGNGRKDRK